MQSGSKPQETVAFASEQKYLQLLRSDGVGLAAFRVYGFESPFSRIVCRTSQRDPKLNPYACIRIPTDNHSNVRAFYYLLLCCCFKNASDELVVPLQTSSTSSAQLLSRFKQFLLDEQTHLEYLSSQLNDRSQQRVLSCNLTMKKFIAELLHLLSNNRSDDLVSVICKYPIVDLLLIVLVRTLVAKHYGRSTFRVDSKLETETVANALRKEFAIKIESSAFEVVFQDSYGIREEHDYVYIDRLPEQKQDSQHKKTQASENTLSRSLLMEVPNPADNIPPLQLELTVGKRIMSLNNARQCSSKRNSYEDSPRKMSEESELSTGGKHNQRLKSSGMDESNDSRTSCVIERIQFGEGVLKKCQQEPSNNPNFHKSKFGPKNNFETEPDRIEFQESGEVTIREKSATVSKSRYDKVDQEKPAPINEEVKSTLCDGTTSQWVLKLLSPAVARVVDQKKQQSLKEMLQNFNEVNKQNSYSGLRTTFADVTSTHSLNPILEYHETGQAKLGNNNDNKVVRVSKAEPSQLVNQRTISKDYFSRIVPSPKVVFTYSNLLPKQQQDQRISKNVSANLPSQSRRPVDIREKSLSPPPGARRIVVQPRYPSNLIKKFYQ